MVNVKNIVLGIGIVIVFGLVLWQGVEAFYPSPQYEKYCSTPLENPAPFYSNCTYSMQLQQQADECFAQKGQPVYNYDVNGCYRGIKLCDFCTREFEKAQLAHAQVVFFIALIIGLIIIVVGYKILSIEPVGSALIGSGIWAFFYGAVINWGNFSNIWRFLLLLIALILLIWIAIKLNSKKSLLSKLK